MEEKKLSEYIDDLKKGLTPKEHKNRTGNADYQRLLDTVRKVRSLRDVEYPDNLFGKRLTDTVVGSEPVKNNRNKIWKRSLIFTTAAVAAAVLLFITLDQVLPCKDANIVYAMEKAKLPIEIPIGYSLDKMAVDQEPVAVMLYYIAAFAEGISAGEVMIPVKTEETGKEPQVKVDVDRNVEENEQKSVDAGHSPWKLDPVFVAQVYASLLLSPDGIVGDYPISYDDIMIIKNDGTDAIAEIKDDKTIAKYVYMKRLIRQDNSGIWTVVGYDPAN